MTQHHYLNGLQEYLEESGVLESGDSKAIALAKRDYKRLYQAQYRKARRKTHPETTVTMTRKQYVRLKSAADYHNLSLPSFILQAALCYLERTYLVPDKRAIAKLEQQLSLTRTDTQLMVRHIRTLGYNDLVKVYASLGERLSKLEGEISRTLRNPNCDH